MAVSLVSPPVRSAYATSTTSLWELIIWAPPNTANTFYTEVRNVLTGVSAGVQTITASSATVGPQNTTGLAPKVWKSTNASTTAVAFHLSPVYLETDQ